MRTSQNSLTLYLCAYVERMFDDIRPTYTGHRDWERDKTRLQHEIRQHGSQIMTITLPSIGKSLDQALDVGQYRPLGTYLGKCRKGEQVPVFLRNLFIQVFHPNDGMLRKDPCLSAVVDLRQLLLGCKKLELSCTQKRIYDEITDFYRTEAGNRYPTLDWGSDAPLSGSSRLSPGFGRISFTDLLEATPPKGDGFDPVPEFDFGDSTSTEVLSSYEELRLVQSTFDWIFAAMGDFSHEGSLLPRHGPGAVSDLKRGMSKYLFHDWPSKLDCIYPYDYYAVHDFMFGEVVGVPKPWRNREVPSTLLSVPKTQKGPRLIAKEPSSYQWIQQLLWQQLETRLRRTPLCNSIAFRDQGHNQRAALAGSVNGDYVTVDLSSASDRLTCWVVERASRANYSLLDRLHACRTRAVRNGVTDNVFSVLQLKKFATMGSAVIFPMQSIIYGCLGIASILISDKRNKILRTAIEDAALQVRVFGDDIIVPKTAYRCLRNLLTDFGLKVNESKTFTGLNFRESCGVDAFRGVDVTPAYIRQPITSARPTDVQTVLDVGNNFWRRGYWHTATWLDASISRWNRLIPVVGTDVGQPGRFSFCGSSVNHLAKRWNRELHRDEVRVFTLTRRRRRTRGTARQDLMQWFIENPAPDLPWEAGTDSVEVSTMRPGWLDKGIFSPV